MHALRSVDRLELGANFANWPRDNRWILAIGDRTDQTGLKTAREILLEWIDSKNDFVCQQIN